MFNNSTAQPSAGRGSSNRTSRTRTPTDTMTCTPSSTTGSQVETTSNEDLLTDPRNQLEQPYVVQTAYGVPVPFPVNAHSWTGIHSFPPSNTTGHSSRSAGGYPGPSAPAFGEPLPPHFHPEQTGAGREMYYNGYPVAAPATAATPLPAAGYPTYPPRPPPQAGAYHPTPNAQGGPASGWQVLCRVDHEERGEVRLSLIIRWSTP